MAPPGRRRAARAAAALLACLAAAPARGGEVRIPAGASRVDLDRHAEFLLDPSGALGLAEVRAAPADARFRPLGGPRSMGFTSAALWLRVELVNEATVPRRLVVVYEAPLLEVLDLWLERDGRLERHRGGFAVPAAERDVAHRGTVLRLAATFAPGERASLWLRAETRAALVAAFSLWEPEARAARDRSLLLFYGVNLGVLLVLAAVHLYAWLALRDRSHLCFVLLLLAFAAYQGAVAGPAAAILWSGSPNLAVAAPRTLSLLAIAAALAFARTFLGTPGRFPRLDVLARGLAVLAFAAVPLAAFAPPAGGALAAALGAVTFLAVLVLAGRAAAARDRAARLFLAAWLLLAGFGLWFVLALLGLAPLGPRVLHGIHGAFSLAGVVLSFALTDRLRQSDLRARADLGRMVEERTRSLVQSVEALRAEGEERRRAIAAMRETEERFRLAFNTSPDAITLNRLDDGLYVAVNEGFTRLTGYRQDDLLGRTAMEIDIFADPADRERLMAGLRQRAQVQNLEARFRTRDGRVLTGLLSAKTLMLRGEPLILSVTRDVTADRQAESERRRLEEQLRQAQKMEALGRLAGGVAHDFNNILTAIIANAGLAVLEAPAGDPNRPLLLEVRDAARRGADLTRQLLAVSRKQMLEPRPVDLNALLANLRRMLGRVIGEDVELRLDLAAGLPAVLADPGQVEQVVLNLAVNARDALDRGGAITISTREAEVGDAGARTSERAAGRYAVVTVADTGRGIPPEMLPHLFEPFFTTKPAGQGTGLGLSTVYGIVRQHGGFIEVESRRGRGSTFRVHLPLAVGEAGAAEELHRAGPLPRGSETVLLVEDEAAVREVTRTVLDRLGYRVLAAASGDEALALAARHDGTLHLILTDVVLPGPSGPEVAEALRARRPACRVLYMSGYPQNLATGLAGAAFLPKPFSPDALARKLREVLG
ncbi:MAG TPA: 7TM diverse intracellular signaling domain-containing protein [Anaeromyxobacteraceae bacterium]|nr:7TM diverse intracellular signaling domain-containing protein [Anaeromyxobacteraceae bacterium]